MQLYDHVRDVLLGVVCSEDGHGPFAFPLQSRARTSPLPPIHCLTCGADCRHLFGIDKPDLPGGAVLLWNRRHAPALVIGWDDAFTVPPRSAVSV